MQHPLVGRQRRDKMCFAPYNGRLSGVGTGVGAENSYSLRGRTRNINHSQIKTYILASLAQLVRASDS